MHRILLPVLSLLLALSAAAQETVRLDVHSRTARWIRPSGSSHAADSRDEAVRLTLEPLSAGVITLRLK